MAASRIAQPRRRSLFSSPGSSWSAVSLGGALLDTLSDPPRPDAIRFRLNMELTRGGGEGAGGPMEVRPRQGFIPLWFNGIGVPAYWGKDVDLRIQQPSEALPRLELRLVNEFTRSDGVGRLWAFGVKRVGYEWGGTGAWVLNEPGLDWRALTMPSSWQGQGFDWAYGYEVPQIAQMHDKLIYVASGTKPFAIDMHTYALEKIPSLTEGQGGLDPVTEAKVCLAHKGMILLMNLRMGGVDCPTRVLWSDINRLYFGLQDLDGVAPVTGWQDLEYGDEIVAAGELHDQIVIYTRRAIWTMRFLPTTNSLWAWRKVYDDKSGRSGLPAYRFSLVSDGRFHYYVGYDGIYRFNPLMTQPERQAWIDAASGLMFKPDSKLRINPLARNSVIGAKVPTTDEIWLSWLSADAGGWTLCLNIPKQYADYMDVGWQALGGFRAFGRNEPIPIGVLYDDNTIKHIQAGFSRYVYEITPEERLRPLLGKQVGPSGYLVLAYGFVPGAGGVSRTRLTAVRAEMGRLSGDAIGLGLRTTSAARLIDPNRQLMRLAAPAPLQFRDWGVARVYATSNDQEILTWATQEEGVYIIWELTVGHPNDTSALSGGSISLGHLLFEIAPVGVTPY